MIQTLENYRLEVPVAEFGTPAEELHGDVMALRAIADPAERHEQAQALFLSLGLKDGTSLVDTVYETIDELEVSSIDAKLAEAETQAQGVIQSLTKVVVKGKPGEAPLAIKPKQVDGIEIEVTPGGELANISYVTRVPQDKAATARNMRMSKRHPSGPTGGVMHIPNATPGRHIR